MARLSNRLICNKQIANSGFIPSQGIKDVVKVRKNCFSLG